MIASSSIARRWPPAVREINEVAVPWQVLAPVATGIALLPLLKPSGPGNTSPVDLLIAVSIGAWLLWAASAHLEMRVPYALAFGLFMLGGAVGALAGSFPAAGLLALAQDLFLLAWCAVVVNVARSPGAFRWLMQAWTWGAFGWAAILIAAVATGNNAVAGITDRTGVRASLTFGDPNYAANYFFLSLMIVMATQLPRRRALRIMVLGALLVALALTGSNGGLLSFAVAIVVVVLSFVARRWGAIPFLATLCTACILGVLVLTAVQSLPLEDWAKASGQPLLRDSIGRSSESAQGREALFVETTALFEQGAPWGLGPGSTKPLLLSQLAPYAHETHDDYIEAIVERGVLGAFGLILLIGSIAARTWSVAAKPLAPAFAAVIPRTSPLVGAALGLAVSASYYQVLHFRHVWTLFAVVAALHLWGRK